MSTIAIGDIHGNAKALEDLLARLIPELRPEDTLVFLGDYIDRGPDASRCLEHIITLRQEAQFPVVTLLGNHEDWMLRTLDDYTRHSWILGMEGLETIASYSSEAALRLRQQLETAGPKLINEKVAICYDWFFDSLPPSHLAFFKQLKPYCLTEDVLCVHGGVDPEAGPIETQPVEVLIWGGDKFQGGYQADLPVVYGHRNDAVEDQHGWPHPLVGGNRTFGIDTIAHGVLTAVRFPDQMVFQSKRYLVSRS